MTASSNLERVNASLYQLRFCKDLLSKRFHSLKAWKYLSLISYRRSQPLDLECALTLAVKNTSTSTSVTGNSPGTKAPHLQSCLKKNLKRKRKNSKNLFKKKSSKKKLSPKLWKLNHLKLKKIHLK